MLKPFLGNDFPVAMERVVMHKQVANGSTAGCGGLRPDPVLSPDWFICVPVCLGFALLHLHEHI